MLRLLIFLGLAFETVTALSVGASSPRLSGHRTHDHDYVPLTPEDQMPKILTKSGVMKVVKGENVTLNCDIIRLGDYSVIWYKTNTILWVLQGNLTEPDVQHVVQDKRIGQVNTSLTIRNVKVSDEAEYSCEVSSNSERRVRHQLIVNVPPSVRPKNDINIVENHAGETAELECQVSGKPTPEVTWEKVGMGKVNAESVDTIFSIANVTSSDAGDYVCIATNSIGEPAKALITLQIQYPPRIIDFESVVHSGLNYEANLWCIVDSSPSPKLGWYKKGAPVNPMRLRKGIEKKNKYFLFFEQVILEDFGSYSCNASNFWGNDSAVIELTGRPLIPKFISNPQGSSPDNYTLTWEVKSYFPVTNYFVFFKNVSSDYEDEYEDWVNVTVPGNPSSSMYHSQRYILTYLLPGSSLVAKVQAQNEFGESDFSDEFTFRTLGEGESSPSIEENMLMETPVQKLEGSSEQHSESDLDKFPPKDSPPLVSEGNNSNNTTSLLMLLKEEDMQNTSSSGVPSMTSWEKRTQVMSLVTAVSLSCFFFLFAMR